MGNYVKLGKLKTLPSKGLGCMGYHHSRANWATLLTDQPGYDYFEYA